MELTDALESLSSPVVLSQRERKVKSHSVHFQIPIYWAEVTSQQSVVPRVVASAHVPTLPTVVLEGGTQCPGQGHLSLKSDPYKAT